MEELTANGPSAAALDRSAAHAPAENDSSGLEAVRAIMAMSNSGSEEDSDESDSSGFGSDIPSASADEGAGSG